MMKWNIDFCEWHPQMNGDIKGTEVIFLTIPHQSYILILTSWNRSWRCRFKQKVQFLQDSFLFLWVTGKEKCRCPSPWLCPDKSIACLHSVSLPALEGRKYFVQEKQLDKLFLSLHALWILHCFLIDLARCFIKSNIVSHRGEKQRENNAGGKTKTSSYFVLWLGGVIRCPCDEWPFYHVCVPNKNKKVYKLYSQ